MENQSLRKRLYQNLSNRPLKHTFLLQSQLKDPKSAQGILKPKILQENSIPTGQIKALSNSLLLNSPIRTKLADLNDTSKVKPKKVEVDKLSKQAKNIIQDSKTKVRPNLKPYQIFAFYEAFPQMIQDFFYLNRISHPYDYQIVSYAKRNHHQYMTISSQGVTLYHDKEAEFLTKQQWMQDQKIYYQLQKISFFNQYKLSKNFMIWKNKMKRHYMKSMSNILSEKLFLTYQYPRKCLKQVRSTSLWLEESLVLFPFEQMEMITWQQLIQSTFKYHSKNLISKIQEQEKKIINSLQTAINLEIKIFKQNNKIKIEGLNSKQQNKQGYIYSQQAILRKQYKRVVKLIKLAEIILLQSKIQLVKRWLLQILQKIKEVNESGLRDEWLTIKFVAIPPEKNSTDIIWNPLKQNFINTFKIIIDKAINLICLKHEKIMNSEVFVKYRNNQDQLLNKDDGHNSLKTLIQQSKFYSDITDQISQCMKIQYQHVVSQQNQLRKFIQIFIKHQNMAPIQNIINQNSVSEISLYVCQWKQDNNLMQDLPDKCFGMIKFDYSLIRKSMMSVAHNSFNQLFSRLPIHLGKMCQQTLRKTDQVFKPIDVIPSDQTFVQFTKAVKRASQQLDDIKQRGKQIKKLQILLNQNKISNLEIHRNNIRTLQKSIDELAKKVNETQTKQDQRLTKFKKNIQQRIKKIKSSAKQYFTKIEQIELQQKNLNSNLITQKISTILPAIIDLDKQATNINHIQNELGLNSTDFTQTHTLYNKTKQFNNLWVQKRLWVQFTEQLLKVHYRNLKCEQYMEKWCQFNSEVNIIKEYIDQNEFLNQLVDQLTKYQMLIQLVKALQSEGLCEKSWNQISQYLTFEFQKRNNFDQQIQKVEPFKDPNDQIYTMRWLMKNQVCLYKQKIQLIVKKSQRQSHLTNVLLLLRNYLNNLTLQFVTKKRQLILLGQNTIVFQQLSQHLASLIDIFNHQYSEYLKKQTKSLVKYYEYVIQILQYYNEFGANWMKYEQLFDPSKHYSKQLSKEAKDFANLEGMWKKIIKSITNENFTKKIHEQATGITQNKNILKAIYKANACWEQIKKSIQEFLDKKRASFHHYFYISDDQLISLMTKSDNNFNINSIVPLIYDNIKSIKFNRDSQNIPDMFISITNTDGQQLKINKSITCKITSEFQQLLRNCQDHWKKTLILNIKKAFSDFISLNQNQISKRKIIIQNVTQVVLAFQHIAWGKLAQQTYLCNQPFGTLHNWIEIQNEQINVISEIIKNTQVHVQQKKLHQVLTQAIYFRDKTQHFLANNVNSLDSYEWQRTLKLCDGTGNIYQISLRALGSVVFYGGEFFGPSNQLYIMPDTQRAYLNLIQIINDREIGVFTNPQNIETIKKFSNLVAQSFRSFTFCQNVSNKMICRILSGVCSQGLWSCFSVPHNWQIVSYIASHIEGIQKCINKNHNEYTYIAQHSKYSISINQTSLPIFFLKISQQEMKNLQKFPKLNFRQFSVVSPNLKVLLNIKSQNIQRGAQVVEIINDLTNYCEKLFKQNYYNQFSLNFAMKILNQYRNHQKDNFKNESISRKICDIIYKQLSFKLKTQDKNLLLNLFQVYNFNGDQQKTKLKRHQTVISYQQKSNLLLSQEKLQKQRKYGNLILKDASKLYQIIMDKQNRAKTIAVVGSSFYGKTSIIQYTKNYMNINNKRKIKIDNIYFQAFKDTELLSATDKSLGIIAENIDEKMQNWIVLDGPYNQKYNRLFSKISQQAVLSNYGVIKDEQNSKLTRFFLETTNLSKITPDFISSHCVLYVQQNRQRVQQIIRGKILNFAYKSYEQQSRIEIKGDQNNQHEVKTYRAKLKQIQLIKQSLQIIINCMANFVQKLSYKGLVRIKSIQLLYQITSCQLAYRSSKLVQCVFMENWDTIKEKNCRKSLQKFAAWAVIWSISTLINTDDKQKFEKAISQITKSNVYDDLSNSIVFPGSGIQIYPLNSPRVQSALSCIPNFGNITNIVNKYNALFDGQSTNKNKFELQFYFDQPNRIRVVTEQAAYFSYFLMLNRHANIPISIYGPQSSGKKSIVDIFNKNNQDSTESYSIRFKKHDPHFISKQIQKPFVKFLGVNKVYYRPRDISKRIHITIDDVSMGPMFQPSTQFLRMLSNTGCSFDDKFKYIQFRQLLLSMTMNQIKLNNLEGVDSKRTLSRLFILQTRNPTKQKLISVFTPILQNLCYQFRSREDEQRSLNFTNKNDQNIIVSATFSIYYFVQDLVNKLSCQNTSQRNRKILLTPKIQQVCHVITNMCQIQQSQQLQMSFYAQLWAHQVIRVFGDKFNNQQLQVLLDEVKKYCFMQFKHSISNLSNTFIFTNLIPKQKSQSKQVTHPYVKCQDLGQIQKQIQQLYQKQNTSLATPLITDEFIYQLVKVYRIVKMPNGHLLIASPLKKSAKFMIKIACFLTKQSVIYHDLEKCNLNFDLHIASSILKQVGSCLIMDLETISQQTLYQLTCLINRNICQFEMSPQVRQKIKNRFITIAQKNSVKQGDTSLKAKALYGENHESVKTNQIQQQIQNQFIQIVIECFNEYMHLLLCIDPYKIQTSKFLAENMSLVKHMHVNWYEFKEETLYAIGERMMQQLCDTQMPQKPNQNLLVKCKKIYQLLSNDQKSDADFLKYLGNCTKTLQVTFQEINKKINSYQQCLKALNNNAKQLEQKKQNTKVIQGKIQQLIKTQEEVNGKIKKIQDTQSEELKVLDAQLKRIKAQKQLLDQQCRQSRTTQALCQQFCGLLPTKSQIQQKLKSKIETKTKSQQYSILVQSALFYLNHASKQQYIREFNKWLQILQLPKIKSIEEIISIFEKVYGPQYMKAPGWQSQSAFSQLKGFHFCQNFMAIPQSIFGAQPIVVKDKQEILVRLLSNINDRNPSINVYSNCKLINYFNFQQQYSTKKQITQKAIRNQIFYMIQKQIQKLLNESKMEVKDSANQQKLAFRKGIIILGDNYKWKPTRNDIDILDRKIIKQKKISTQNRIVIRGDCSPNIIFYADKQDLKNRLVQRSMKTQFGQSFMNQKRRSQSLLRQIHIKKQRRIQQIIKVCELNQPQQKMVQTIVKLQNQLNELQKTTKKINSMLQQRKVPSDLFLIEWFLNQIEIRDSISFQRIGQIYQFIHKCFVQINYTRQQRIQCLQNIEPEVIKNWRSLIQANLLESQKLSLNQLVKFTMPLQQSITLILVPHKPQIQNQIQKNLGDCNYLTHFVNMHTNCSILTNQHAQISEQSKNLWVFQNFISSNQQHIQTFLQHLQKNQKNYCPIAIIITDNCQNLSKNLSLLQKINKLKIIKYELTPNFNVNYYEQIMKIGQQQFKEKKSTFLQANKTNRKTLVEQISSNTQLSQRNLLNQEEISRIKQGIKKFLTILTGLKVQNSQSFKYQISLKSISSQIQLIKNKEDVKLFLTDMLKLPMNSEQIIEALFSQNKNKQIEDLLNYCKDQLNMQKQYNQQKLKKQQYLFVSEPKIQQIQDLVNQLPFGFNSQDFNDTNECFSMWLIAQANKFNQRKSTVKKYLMQCIKILKGNKLNYWREGPSYGFEMIKPEHCKRLNNEYKIIRRGLQLAGLITNMETSLKDIKLSNSSNPQHQNLLTLAAQSFDCRSLQGFSQKLVTIAMIKASRKLKFPLKKIKKTWKLVNSSASIQQPVVGQNCICLNASIYKKELLSLKKQRISNQQNSVKLLLMLYDPTPIPVAVQQTSKQQSKKDKQKKIKNQITKPVNAESESNLMQIPIKLCNGKILDHINVQYQQENRNKIIMEQICFKLF